MTRRAQINVRSTAVIDAVLHNLMIKLNKSKTEVIYAALMYLANKELTETELLECLKKDYE